MPGLKENCAVLLKPIFKLKGIAYSTTYGCTSWHIISEEYIFQFWNLWQIIQQTVFWHHLAKGLYRHVNVSLQSAQKFLSYPHINGGGTCIIMPCENYALIFLHWICMERTRVAYLVKNILGEECEIHWGASGFKLLVGKCWMVFHTKAWL